MWKYLFEFADGFFAIIPVKRWREHLRVKTLFDYRRKFNALRKLYPEMNFFNIRLAKGGGSLVFIYKKDTFKVRKVNSEATNFARFETEKRITDALRPYCTIQIPKIEFLNIDGYTFYKTDFIPGIPLVNVSSRRIRKYQTQISRQLAEFIYKKFFADPVEIQDLRAEKQLGYSWVHGDMCSNMLVDPKTMVITGVIDWEWAAYRDNSIEFTGLVWVRKKMRKIGLDKTVYTEFQKICKVFNK